MRYRHVEVKSKLQGRSSLMESEDLMVDVKSIIARSNHTREAHARVYRTFLLTHRGTWNNFTSIMRHICVRDFCLRQRSVNSNTAHCFYRGNIKSVKLSWNGEVLVMVGTEIVVAQVFNSIQTFDNALFRSKAFASRDSFWHLASTYWDGPIDFLRLQSVSR